MQDTATGAHTMTNPNDMTALDFVSLSVSNLNYTIDAALYDWYTRRFGWQQAQAYSRRWIMATPMARALADDLIARMEHHNHIPASLADLDRLIHRYVTLNYTTKHESSRREVAAQIKGIILDRYEYDR